MGSIQFTAELRSARADIRQKSGRRAALEDSVIECPRASGSCRLPAHG